MITVRVGRLDETQAEGLLRPVRSDFSGITAASRRVDASAGEDVRTRLEGMGELPVGGAVVTPGGELAVSFIIHVVLESPEESLSSFGVQRALMNGLRRASDWGMTSLALPPLGLGAGSLEPDEVARMVVEVLVHHQSEGEPPEDVVIVVESTYEEEMFRRLLAAAQP
jgi:O-acetyl-ADP-ribose deacetylase (regulator of RNase III)